MYLRKDRNLKRFSVGSNQFKKKSKTSAQNSKLLIGYFVIFTAMLVGTASYKLSSPEYAHAQVAVKSQTKFFNPYVPMVEEEPLTLEQEQNWDAMKRMARKLAPLYDYPSEVIIAQMALESARGTSKYCTERNNCFGIGAYDHDPDQAFWFENKEQAILEYMRLIKTRYTEAYALRDNPEQMIQAIWENGYATDPNYVSKVQWIMNQEGI